MFQQLKIVGEVYSRFKLFPKRFGGMMPTFLLIFWYFIEHTFIASHSYSTFIRRHSPRFLSISSSLVSTVGKTSLGCQAKNRTRACHTASRRNTNWARPHPNWATPHTYFQVLVNIKIFGLKGRSHIIHDEIFTFPFLLWFILWKRDLSEGTSLLRRGALRSLPVILNTASSSTARVESSCY